MKVLRHAFVENESYTEIIASTGLSGTRIKQILPSATLRLVQFLHSTLEKIELISDLEQELASMRKELAELKEKCRISEASLARRVELPPETQAILNTPIDQVGFSARIVNVFEREDIRTVKDIVQYRRKDFAGLRNTGKESLDEIEVFLKSKGLGWEMEL
jgi:DNA-directed RNA polymerase alpha subunit